MKSWLQNHEVDPWPEATVVGLNLFLARLRKRAQIAKSNSVKQDTKSESVKQDVQLKEVRNMKAT